MDTVYRTNPRRYCVTSPNSAGAGALMGWDGTTSITLNDLVLTVAACPPKQFGFFFYGSKEVQVPAGDGYRMAGRYDASYMLGWAGIGHFYLRLAEPGKVPLPLMVYESEKEGAR